MFLNFQTLFLQYWDEAPEKMLTWYNIMTSSKYKKKIYKIIVIIIIDDMGNIPIDGK